MGTGEGQGGALHVRSLLVEVVIAVWAVCECVQESEQASCEELKAEQKDVGILWRFGGAAQAGGGSRAWGRMGEAATVDLVLVQIVLVVVARSPLGAR